ncbi:MAG: DUF4236 domain-containing protein [Paludibacteraceae bacterium]
MAWNFRKRVKVAPGVYVNIGKHGTSTSIGSRGAKVTFGKNGTYFSTGIPGTGLYNRQKIGGKQSDNLERNNIISTSYIRGFILWLLIFIICAMIVLLTIYILGVNNRLHVENIDDSFIVFLVAIIIVASVLIYGWGVFVTKWRANRNATFSYNREKRKAQKILESLPIKDAKRDILQSYIQCLTISEQIDKQNQILEQLKKGTTAKEKDIISEVEQKIEALDVELKNVQYDADKGLTEDQKQLFDKFCIDFEILSTSDKIWFVTGSNSTGVFREETTFDLGVFDYIYSKYKIPIINIPQSNIKFYFYPSFIIRSESTTNFTIYSWNKVELHVTTQNFVERDVIPGMDDAVLVSTSYLHETKNGSIDLRYSYNPLLTTYDYGKYIFPLFNAMTFYISNKEKAEQMAATYIQYRDCVIAGGVAKNKQVLSENLNTQNNKETPMSLSDQLLSISDIDPLFIDVARWIVETQNASISRVQRRFLIGFNRAGRLFDQLEAVGIIGPMKQGYRDVLIADIQQLEKKLQNLNVESSCQKQGEVLRNDSHPQLTTQKLDDLIGLASVKKEIQTLTNFIKIQQKRAEQGLKASSLSYHCVFTGNPGTGKTTVARIVADIYKDLGILKKGQLVETDRAGLVGEYVGQTAVKTNKIIDSALDGVLFIDEAYTLIAGGTNDYGKEAIATLLKRMEDDRNRLVVILAGYTEDMKLFIDSNPGLQSRFNRYIEFPDYSPIELLQIFEGQLQHFDYKLTEDAQSAIKVFFERVCERKDKNFGNARFVRNIFEKTLEKQANRLSQDPDLTIGELKEILVEDLPI